MAGQSSAMIGWSWTDVSVLGSQVFGQALMDSCGILHPRIPTFAMPAHKQICQISREELTHPFTKPPLIQESRLTGGNFPDLEDLVERKVPVDREMGAANSLNSFIHDCTLVLCMQLIQTGSLLLMLPLSSVLGFLLYADTDNERAVTTSSLAAL